MPAQTENSQDKSVADLLRDLSAEMTTLIHQEVDLAKAELGEKSKKLALGAGMFGGVGVMVLLGLAALVTAAIAALAQVMSLWLAAVIIAIALMAIAGTLALCGRLEVTKGTPPVPEQAIESTKEDVAWLKTQAKSARP